MGKIDPSEITPEHVYLNRRQLIAGMGALAAASLLGACARKPGGGAPPTSSSGTPTKAAAPDPTAKAVQLESELTPLDEVAGYNNFYEFTLSKTRVAELAEDFKTSPWQVEVGGLVDNPRTFTLDDLLAFEQEERIYRMRCVEAWSMVIPWRGFPLSELLDAVAPTSEAQFVRFETLADPEQMPGLQSGVLDWPYVEGLRLDEAMHELTILATGLYGKDLPPQNGAPVRLVVPWKYGFKSIKSIVRIDLVDEMPVSSWTAASPNEYGFYANVNPNVPHPRWSQATERVIGRGGRRKTELFNGYEEEVAHLYAGMDLEENF
ncbi:MAG: protein-methionine-sulfoxide reductase catalytic subunit MsrP [Anaerolineae bacterium]|jgi:sulfoxide reductase catalytic subunit YedY